MTEKFVIEVSATGTPTVIRDLAKIGAASGKSNVLVKALRGGLGGLLGTMRGLKGPLKLLLGGAGLGGLARRLGSVIGPMKLLQGALGGLSGLLGALTGPISALAGDAGLSGLIGKTVSVNKEFQNLKGTMGAFLGSAEKAGQAFATIQKFSEKTPFTVRDLTAAFNQMLASGLTPSIKSLKEFGNIAAASSKTVLEFTNAVTDAAASKFEGLKKFGIQAVAEGKKVAISFAGVTTRVNNDGKSIKDFLVKLGETKFAGAMQQQVMTIGGAFTNLGNVVDGFFSKIGKAGFNKALVSLTNRISEIISSSGGLAETIGGVLTAGVQILEVAVDQTAEALKGFDFNELLLKMANGLVDFAQGGLRAFASLVGGIGDIDRAINTFKLRVKKFGLLFINSFNLIKASVQVAAETIVIVHRAAFGRVRKQLLALRKYFSGIFGDIGKAMKLFLSGDFVGAWRAATRDLKFEIPSGSFTQDIRKGVIDAADAAGIPKILAERAKIEGIKIDPKAETGFFKFIASLKGSTLTGIENLEALRKKFEELIKTSKSATGAAAEFPSGLIKPKTITGTGSNGKNKTDTRTKTKNASLGGGGGARKTGTSTFASVIADLKEQQRILLQSTETRKNSLAVLEREKALKDQLKTIEEKLKSSGVALTKSQKEKIVSNLKAIETGKTKNKIDEENSRLLDQVTRKLDPVTAAKKGLAKTEEILTRLLKAGRIEGDKYNAMLERAKTAAEDQIKPVEAFSKSIEEEIKFLRMSNREREIAIALQRKMKQLTKAGGQPNKSEIEAGLKRRQTERRRSGIRDGAQSQVDAINPVLVDERASLERGIFQDAFDKEIISADELANKFDEIRLRGLEASTELGAGFERSFLKMRLQANDFAAFSETAMNGFADKSADAITQLVTTGKANFKDLAGAVIQDILRMTIRMLIFRAISSIAGASGGVSSGIGGIAAGSLGGTAGLAAMSHGGIIEGRHGVDRNLMIARVSRGEEHRVLTKGQQFAERSDGQSTVNNITINRPRNDHDGSSFRDGVRDRRMARDVLKEMARKQGRGR